MYKFFQAWIYDILKIPVEDIKEKTLTLGKLLEAIIKINRSFLKPYYIWLSPLSIKIEHRIDKRVTEFLFSDRRPGNAALCLWFRHVGPVGQGGPDDQDFLGALCTFAVRCFP